MIEKYLNFSDGVEYHYWYYKNIINGQMGHLTVVINKPSESIPPSSIYDSHSIGTLEDIQNFISKENYIDVVILYNEYNVECVNNEQTIRIPTDEFFKNKPHLLI